MSMNIKNPEAHRLASILSKLTGETMTKAVTEALRERLARETRRRDKGKIVDEIMAIGRRCAALPERDARSADEILYDERGMPK